MARTRHLDEWHCSYYHACKVILMLQNYDALVMCMMMKLSCVWKKINLREWCTKDALGKWTEVVNWTEKGLVFQWVLPALIIYALPISLAFGKVLSDRKWGCRLCNKKNNNGSLLAMKGTHVRKQKEMWKQDRKARFIGVCKQGKASEDCFT